LHTLTGEGGSRSEHAVIRVADEHRNQRAESDAMRLQYLQACVQREYETVAPLPWLHARSLTRVIRRELLIERDDDRLLAWKIAIEQADADPRLFRDIPQGRRLVPAPGDQPHCRGVHPVSRCGALGRLARGPASLARLDILSEHVH